MSTKTIVVVEAWAYRGSVMDRDTHDVSLIRYVNRLSIPAGHSPIFYKKIPELFGTNLVSSKYV